jgi:hypothetical protein
MVRKGINNQRKEETPFLTTGGIYRTKYHAKKLAPT